MVDDAIAFEGAVMLGSRLKRLAERFQSGAERIAADCNLPTQPSQMPLLTALHRHGPQTVGDLAERIGISQPAVTRIQSRLLELGLNPGSVFDAGDGYWEVAPRSTALHVAAWRARPEVVALLIARGAPVDTRDGAGRTPLALAVRACVDSWWRERRTSESVSALLAAGASVDGVQYPSGYDAVDQVLRDHGAKPA